MNACESRRWLLAILISLTSCTSTNALPTKTPEAERAAGAGASGPALRGAASVLSALIVPAVEPPKAVDGDREKQNALRDDLAAFERERAQLTPQALAERWLALFDEHAAALRRPAPTAQPFFDAATSPEGPVQALMNALPGPDAWPFLIRAIEARPASAPLTRRESGLRLLAGALSNDDARMKAVIERLNQDSSMDAVATASLLEPSAYGAPDPAKVVAALEKMLSEKSGGLDRAPAPVFVPDLVTLIGEERARSLLTRLLLANRFELKTAGEKTSALAKRIALDHVRKLKIAQWRLLSSTRDVELAQAFMQRFGVPRALASKVREDIDEGFERDYAHYVPDEAPTAALCFLVFGLIERDQVDAARKVARDVESLAWDSARCAAAYDEMRPEQHAAAIYDLAAELIEADPSTSSAWLLAQPAAMLGRGDAMRALLTRAMERGSSERGFELASVIFRSLLAEDRVEDATRFVESYVQSLEGRSSPMLIEQARRWGYTLAVAGHLTAQPVIVDRGLALYAKRLRAAEDEGMCALLLRLERYADAEQCFQDGIAHRLSQSPGGYSMDVSRSIRPLLLGLVELYGKLGRYAEIQILLDQAPWWGGAFFEEEMEHCPGSTVAAIARTLHLAGRTASAIHLLQRAILLDRKSDEAYALLLELDEPAALHAWLERLHALDRFEERPLIWRAKLWLKQGKVADAEQAARRALGIDPSDGEQEPGQRIYGYWVMAETLRALGKTKEAALFESVVRSIRGAERGDELKEAGLLKRALAAYRQADQAFSDAYCVHWRMAEQLYDLGAADEAIPHYRAAFSLMPQQFGRIASFCMHCANVFGRAHAREVAETVLLEVLQRENGNARAHHLLAQLRIEQGRYVEAKELLQRAVALDPEYGDAWASLLENSGQSPLSPAEAESIRLRLFELDPFHEHFSGGVDGTRIRDLAKLWKISASQKALQMPEPPRDVMLAASAKRKAEIERLMPGGDRFRPRLQSATPYSIPTPAEQLSRQPAIAYAVRMMAE